MVDQKKSGSEPGERMDSDEQVRGRATGEDEFDDVSEDEDGEEDIDDDDEDGTI